MTEYKSEAQAILDRCSAFEGSYAAGGAVTSVFTAKDINDVDLYFKSKLAFDGAVATAYERGMWCVDVSKRAVTFSDDGNIIQMMHFDFFPEASYIFDAFDYTIVMGAYDFDSKEFVLHPDFMKHNSQRFLRFNPGTLFPLASATRVLKYQSRGYTIGKGDILKIALACRGVKIETWDDLKDQIGGAYGNKVILEGDDKEFSLEAAIEALTVAYDGTDKWLVSSNDNQPGSAISLQMKLSELKGEPFDPDRYDGGEDGEGYPIKLAA